MSRIQVDILGISSNQTTNGAYALVLKETDGMRRIPIIIGGFEAQAIALELEGIAPPRPLTHDLVKHILQALNVSVVEASIAELKDGIFFATILLSDGQEIDARPSDAIAVAVRYGAPIYISEEVMNEASFIPEDDDTEPEGGEEGEESDDLGIPKEPKTPPRKLTKLEQMQADLDSAIASEDYEKAARIRDDLNKLKSGGVN
jgi:bifunctional DNase/RNase